MFEFLIKRLATIVPTLIFVSMLIFGLQQLLPGDPAKVLAGEDDRTGAAGLRDRARDRHTGGHRLGRPD